MRQILVYRYESVEVPGGKGKEFAIFDTRSTHFNNSSNLMRGQRASKSAWYRLVK